MEKLVKQCFDLFKRYVFDCFAEFERIAFVVDHMGEFSCELGRIEYLDVGRIGCALDAVEVVLTEPLASDFL